jgi:hypothetical protein
MADIFTKALCKLKFIKFRDKMGLVRKPLLSRSVEKCNLEGLPHVWRPSMVEDNETSQVDGLNIFPKSNLEKIH